jgi:hypothetical protein
VSALLDACKLSPAMVAKLERVAPYKLHHHIAEADDVFRNRLEARILFRSIAEITGAEAYIGYIIDFLSRLKPDG